MGECEVDKKNGTACTASRHLAALSSTPQKEFQLGRRVKKAKEVIVHFVTMLAPPLLASYLLKTIVLLTTGVVIYQGVPFLISRNSGVHLSPIVNTFDGPVQGKLAYSRNGSPYWQYFSIPYASPPQRFQPPTPVQPWKKVRQGLNYPSGCVQFEPIAITLTWGQESCLFLNVFSPKKLIGSEDGKAVKNVPVIVFFYGGCFLEGQSSFYQPDFIMDQDVVLVTLNYRLGPLGFLNFQEKNDTTYPRGNMGLADQKAALVWVKRNIKAFGGDPGNVVIMGESAGAVSVHFHMQSKQSKGLFQKAIAISSSSFSPWGFTKKPREIAFEYGSRLGCPINNASSLLQCYLNIDAAKLVSLQHSWQDPIKEKDVFVPSVETILTEDAFLTHAPDELIENDEAISDVPLMTGFTSGEGGLRSGRFRAIPGSIPVLNQDWDSLIHNVLFLDDPVSPELAAELRRFYFGNLNFTQDPQEFLKGMTQLTSDTLFVEPVHRAAMQHAKRGNPTYLFYYDYRPAKMIASFSAFSQVTITDSLALRWIKLVSGVVYDWIVEFVFGEEGGHIFGVGHAEDLFQMWNVLGITKWITWLDLDFSESLIQAIVDFAYDSERVAFRGTPWPPINGSSTIDDLLYMKLDNEEKARVVQEPFVERMKFWETLRSKFPGNEI